MHNLKARVYYNREGYILLLKGIRNPVYEPSLCLFEHDTGISVYIVHSCMYMYIECKRHLIFYHD